MVIEIFSLGHLNWARSMKFSYKNKDSLVNTDKKPIHILKMKQIKWKLADKSTMHDLDGVPTPHLRKKSTCLVSTPIKMAAQIRKII